MKRKYKLTKETIEYGEIKLYRIEATANLGFVSKGSKGGFIEKEDNLSQYGNAWVSGDAWVYGNARVYGKIKCETGHYVARKHKSWKFKEIKTDDEHSRKHKSWKFKEIKTDDEHSVLWRPN